MQEHACLVLFFSQHHKSHQTLSGADPGFEKGGGAGGSGVRPREFFGLFRGLFTEFGTKRGGCAPPLDSRLIIVKLS